MQLQKKNGKNDCACTETLAHVEIAIHLYVCNLLLLLLNEQKYRALDKDEPKKTN